MLIKDVSAFHLLASVSMMWLFPNIVIPLISFTEAKGVPRLECECYICTGETPSLALSKPNKTCPAEI